MTPKPGPEKRYPVELYVRITEEHYALIRSLGYKTVSAAVRAIFDAAVERPELIRRPPGRPPSP